MVPNAIGVMTGVMIGVMMCTIFGTTMSAMIGAAMGEMKGAMKGAMIGATMCTTLGVTIQCTGTAFHSRVTFHTHRTSQPILHWSSINFFLVIPGTMPYCIKFWSEL